MAREASSNRFIEILPGRELLENRFDSLMFFAMHNRFLELLQVNGRTIVGVDFLEFVAREHMKQKIALFQPMSPFLAELRPHFRRSFSVGVVSCRTVCAKQSRRILGLVQIISQSIPVLLCEEIQPLLGRVNWRGQFFKVLFRRRKLFPESFKLGLGSQLTLRICFLKSHGNFSLPGARPRREFPLLLLNPFELRPQLPSLLHQSLVGFPRFAQFL